MVVYFLCFTAVLAAPPKGYVWHGPLYSYAYEADVKRVACSECQQFLPAFICKGGRLNHRPCEGCVLKDLKGYHFPIEQKGWPTRCYHKDCYQPLPDGEVDMVLLAETLMEVEVPTIPTTKGVEALTEKEVCIPVITKRPLRMSLLARFRQHKKAARLAPGKLMNEAALAKALKDYAVIDSHKVDSHKVDSHKVDSHKVDSHKEGDEDGDVSADKSNEGAAKVLIDDLLAIPPANELSKAAYTPIPLPRIDPQIAPMIVPGEDVQPEFERIMPQQHMDMLGKVSIWCENCDETMPYNEWRYHRRVHSGSLIPYQIKQQSRADAVQAKIKSPFLPSLKGYLKKEKAYFIADYLTHLRCTSRPLIEFIRSPHKHSAKNLWAELHRRDVKKKIKDAKEALEYPDDLEGFEDIEIPDKPRLRCFNCEYPILDRNVYTRIPKFVERDFTKDFVVTNLGVKRPLSRLVYDGSIAVRTGGIMPCPTCQIAQRAIPPSTSFMMEDIQGSKHMESVITDIGMAVKSLRPVPSSKAYPQTGGYLLKDSHTYTWLSPGSATPPDAVLGSAHIQLGTYEQDNEFFMELIRLDEGEDVSFTLYVEQDDRHKIIRKSSPVVLGEGNKTEAVHFWGIDAKCAYRLMLTRNDMPAKLLRDITEDKKEARWTLNHPLGFLTSLQGSGARSIVTLSEIVHGNAKVRQQFQVSNSANQQPVLIWKAEIKESNAVIPAKGYLNSSNMSFTLSLGSRSIRFVPREGLKVVKKAQTWTYYQQLPLDFLIGSMDCDDRFTLMYSQDKQKRDIVPSNVYRQVLDPVTVGTDYPLNPDEKFQGWVSKVNTLGGCSFRVGLRVNDGMVQGRVIPEATGCAGPESLKTFQIYIDNKLLDNAPVNEWADFIRLPWTTMVEKYARGFRLNVMSRIEDQYIPPETLYQWTDS